MSEINKDIPASWLLVSLDKLGKVEWGNTSITKKSYVEKGVVAFSATGPDGFLPEAEWFGPGIVVSAIGANCGKCFYADGEWATIKNTIVFQSNEEFVLSKFLYYQLDGQRNWYISGSGQPFITLKTAREKEVVLPPLNEQKRIVAKIEELFSELDSGIESLKTAREQLKVYRQSVLKHAFEGKLTAPWREKNKNKLESADQLLARIKRERDAEGKRTGKKKLKEPRPLSDEDFVWLSSVPEGWCWERLGWMTCGIEYGTGAKSSERGEVPVLRMGNIQNMKFDWDDLVYTSDAQEISDYLLHEGDVLFNRTNSPEWVGKTAIYKGERPAVFAGYLMRVNQINSIVDPRFLNFYLNSHTAKQYGNKVKTDGVNQSNINGEKLANYPFPFCSLEEQRIIVDLLEEQMSSIDRTEADIDFQLQKSEALRQSILKKAFSGQLVAQNPADESASLLLERIRSEKATPKPTAKKPKEKRRAA